MKAKMIGTVLTAVLAMPASAVLAAYSSIQHNLFNGQQDTSFDPNTGLFQIAAVNQGLLTLNDPVALGGTVSNVSVNLVTTFNSVLFTGEALFTGGSFSLSFDYDPVGPDPVDSHNISGPITALFFSINPGLNNVIDGAGRWTATNVDLPGTNIWPVAAFPNNFSSIDSLSIAFGQNLSTFDWTTPLTGRVESLYQLFPDGRAIPEPASLTLLALGALGLLRRRR